MTYGICACCDNVGDLWRYINLELPNIVLATSIGFGNAFRLAQMFEPGFYKEEQEEAAVWSAHGCHPVL